MNDDIKDLMKQYEEDGSDCNRAGLKSMILQFAFADGIDRLEKLTELVDFFEANAIKKHEKEIQGEKDNEVGSFYTDSNGIGCIDANKLPPGMDILDVLRGVARKQEMAHSDEEKEGTNILRTIQDLIEKDEVEKNGPLETSIEKIDWKRIPNFTGFKSKEWASLNAGLQKWKDEISSGGLLDEDCCYKDSFDRELFLQLVQNCQTFKEYDDEASPEVARRQWLNKEYANIDPDSIDLIFKYIGKGRGRYSYEFLIDRGTNKIVMVYFSTTHLTKNGIPAKPKEEEIVYNILPVEKPHTDLKLKLGQKIDWRTFGGGFKYLPDEVIKKLNKVKAKDNLDWWDRYDSPFNGNGSYKAGDSRKEINSWKTFDELYNYDEDNCTWVSDEYKPQTPSSVDWGCNVMLISGSQDYSFYVFYDKTNGNLIGVYEEHC